MAVLLYYTAEYDLYQVSFDGILLIKRTQIRKEITMKIEHIAMYVNELERAKRFFEKYFGAISGDGYHNKKTGFRSYFLSFDDGPRTTGDGYYESCIVDIEKNQIEITV